MTSLLTDQNVPPLSCWTQLAFAPLLMCMLIYCVAYLANRWEPVDATVLWLVLAPLGWLVATPSQARLDRGQQVVVVLFLSWVAWMATLQAVLPQAFPSGWWRVAERCAYLSAFILILATRPCSTLAMRAFGASAAVAVAGALAVNLANGCFAPGDTRSFGFGHINIIANTAGPSLIAWCVWLASSHGKERAAWGSWILAAIGMGALMAIAIGTERRGVPLAMAAAIFTIVAMRLLAWRRPLGLLFVALPLLLAAPRLIALVTVTVPSLRQERVALYRAGFDGVVASFPFGFGHYGAKHLVEVQGEHARHLTATGTWGYHIHNEPLDILLDGGIPALAVVLAILVLSALRLRSLSDRRARYAFGALGAAIGVHAMTDNVYGTEIGQAWLAAVFGLLWSAPIRSANPGAGWFPALRFLQWPLVLVSCWGATRAIYPAVLHREAYPSVRYQSLQQCLNAQTVSAAGLQILTGSDPQLEVDDRRVVVNEVVRRTGWTAVLAAQDPSLLVDCNEPEIVAAALLRLLRLSAFNKTAYEPLLALVKRHPHIQPLIPEDVQVRLLYLSGKPGLPVPDLSREPLTMEAAADLYASITWSIANGAAWQEIERPLWNLCRRYGDIPGVTLLVLDVLTEAPPGSLPWIADAAPILEVGLRFVPRQIVPTLAKTRTAAAAAAVMPLLHQWYPEALHGIRTGHIEKMSESGVDLYLHLVRIHHLARMAAGQSALIRSPGLAPAPPR